VFVAGPSGARAGLELAGGILILCGPTGPLLADCQAGGLIVPLFEPIGPHVGRGRLGGRLTSPRIGHAGFDRPRQDDAISYQEAILILQPWLPEELAAIPWPWDDRA
jgi:hypothetical protein